MFADPQVITVNAVPQTLARTIIEKQKATYTKVDGSYILTISHQNMSNNRIRSMARFDLLAVVPDPLTAVNDYETLTYYSIIDRPQAGFSEASITQHITGYKAWYDAAVMAKLIGGES